jgi:two-component sensor histidine kinase
VNKDLKIQWANKTAANSVNKTSDKLIGRKCYELWADPDKICENCPTVKAFHTKKRELIEINTPDGRVWEESGEPVLDAERNMLGVVEIARDITDQKKAQQALKVSLEEKETLLQEIHHRVKNNLTVVSSLLKLQANGMDDERLKEALNESQNRIYAMSAVHESLYSSKNLSEIELKVYVTKISRTLIQTYSTNPANVKFNTDSEEIKIGINQASPIGLIINELISNSLKYAFPNEREGKIDVSMKKTDNELNLVIKDDGVGMPDDLDWKNSKSLGLKLVRTLVENQLDGSVDMESTNGTKFTIKFNIET